MKVALIPCAPTEWSADERLLGRVEVPMSDAGRGVCAQWASGLMPSGVARVFHATDELATETARLIASALGASVRRLRGLEEVDLGLWAGLTEEQLRARYPSAYDTLRESPLSISAPGGEALSTAVHRVRECLRRQIRKNGLPAIAFVLRPLVLAAARCELESRPLAELWGLGHATDGPVLIEMEPRRVRTLGAS